MFNSAIISMTFIYNFNFIIDEKGRIYFCFHSAIIYLYGNISLTDNQPKKYIY